MFAETESTVAFTAAIIAGSFLVVTTILSIIGGMVQAWFSKWLDRPKQSEVLPPSAKDIRRKAVFKRARTMLTIIGMVPLADVLWITATYFSDTASVSLTVRLAFDASLCGVCFLSVQVISVLQVLFQSIRDQQERHQQVVVATTDLASLVTKAFHALDRKTDLQMDNLNLEAQINELRRKMEP